jgi:hypothetical protein
MKRYLTGFFLVVLTTACVDRINFNVGDGGQLPVVVQGHISDEPGPYEISVTRGFDVESRYSLKVGLQVRTLELSDDAGNVEQLTEVGEGLYRTRANGIRGVIGRSYKLKVELLDGRVYESVPEKILAAGSVDKIDHELVSYVDKNNLTTYGFNIYVDAQPGTNSNQLMWKMVGTYQISTNPELATQSCGESQCPAPLPCSGFIVVGTELVSVAACECCHCWLNLFNDIPAVSDDQRVREGAFRHVKVGFVPINQWTLMYKTRVEVQQFSLSPTAFEFWTAIKAQKEATSSLFQPPSGQIPGNFVQIAGNKTRLEGIFYAASVTRNSIFLTAADIPDKRIIPQAALIVTKSCLSFPHSTNIEPDYWRQ